MAASYVLLSKFEHDAQNSLSALLNKQAQEIPDALVYDAFSISAVPKKSALLLGESFEADILIGTYSTQVQAAISVNGSTLPVENGRAKYAVRPTKVGEQSYQVQATITNPLTGETEQVTQDFRFEVVQPSIVVAADNMNVFYIGIDNPITVAAAGIPSNDLELSIRGGGARLIRKSKTSYIVNASQQTNDCTITITDRKSGRSYPFKYRVKRVPDPVIKFGGKVSGAMGNGQVKAQIALNPEIENFDFEVRCSVESYELLRRSRTGGSEFERATGDRFPPNVQALLSKAQSGDSYTFMNMQVKCPGDTNARQVPGPSILVQ